MNLSTIDMIVVMLVVMALGALSGWLAGTGFYHLLRFKLSRRQKRSLLVHALPTVSSVLVFLVILAPLFNQLGGATAVLLGFLAIMIFPFSILGAQTAWKQHEHKQLAHEKLKTVSKAFLHLRGHPQYASRK